MASRFSVEGVFRVQDRMTRQLDGIARSVNRFQSRASYGFRELSAMARQFQTGFAIAGAAIAAVAAAGVAALRDLIDTGMEFDRVMAEVGARFGHARSAEEFHALEQAAIDASTATGFTLEETAGALAELGAAGANATEAIQQLPIVLDTASAAGISLSEAGDVITDVLSAFELGAGNAAERGRELARVADVMSLGANSSSQTFEQLREAMVNVQTAAHSAGMDIETTTALLATLAENGQKGSRAGSQLSSMLGELQTPTPQAARALRRLGIAVRDATTHEMLPAVDIIGNFERALGGLNAEARDRALDQIFGEEGLRAMGGLLTQGSAKLRQFDTAMRNAAGSTAEVAQMMRDSGAGDVAIMNAEIEALKVQLWAFIRGPVRAVVQAISAWIHENEGIITGGFGDAVKLISDHMEELRVIGMGLAVVLGAIAAIGLFLSAIFIGTFAAIVVAFSVVVGAILYGLGWIYENAMSVASSVADAFGEAWDSIVSFLFPAIEFIVGAFTIMKGTVMRELQPVFDWLGRAATWVRGVFAQIAGYVGGIWASVSGAGSNAFGSLLAIAQPAIDALSSAFTRLGEIIAGVWRQVVDSFNATVGPILQQLSGWVSAVREVGNQEMQDHDRRPGGGALREHRQVVSPHDRVVRAIEERTTTDRAEVTITDRTGRAQTTRRPRNRGASRIRVHASGAT